MLTEAVMAHPYHHARASVKKWGSEVNDYLQLHTWFDLIWTGKLFFSFLRRRWSSR